MGWALYLPLAFLFLANIIPSKAQSGDDGATEVMFDMRSNFTLQCTLPNDNKLDYVWMKNNTLVSDVKHMTGRFELRNGNSQFQLNRTTEDDYGNYSCALAGGGAAQRWSLRSRPQMRLPPNSNVVEGQKLKLVCKVIGKPLPEVKWLFNNRTDDETNFTDVTEALGERANITKNDQDVPGGMLVLAAAQSGDAGRYRCTADHATVHGTTVLRVKDMYAALWPFLGICAEVFVLCAIILVYEKRRTKPELDDSDTDNHDQKKS